MANIYDYGKCYVSELRTLISPHGVYLCPLYRGKPQYSFGNVGQNTFKEIWNGESRKKLMEAINPCKDCLPKCSRHLSNMEINRIGAGNVSSDVQDDFDLFF